MTDLPLIRLQPGRDKRVAAGHPWIFSNEIAMTPELREVPLGAPVRVEAAQRQGRSASAASTGMR